MLSVLKHRWTLAIATLAMAATFALATAQSSSAALAWAYGAHTVCAQSLTHYLDAGGTVTLHDGHPFNITAYLSGGRVYGTNAGGRAGWVYNGWFYNGLTC